MPVALQPKNMLSMHLEFFTKLALKAAREGAVLILVGKLFQFTDVNGITTLI